MKPNEFFDEIYCINLPERTDRWKQCEDEFKKHNLDVIRVEGSKGTPINGLKSGEVGLTLTNVNILKSAKERGLNKILILEDDVVFIENFVEKFENKIELLPDSWDTIQLGGNHHFFRGKFECITKKIDFDLTIHNYKQLDYEICTTRWSQTTHAVGINRRMFDTIIGYFSELRAPIDMIYCNLQIHNNFNMYAFIPSLALQRASFSDILNRQVDYNNRLHYF